MINPENTGVLFAALGLVFALLTGVLALIRSLERRTEERERDEAINDRINKVVARGMQTARERESSSGEASRQGVEDAEIRLLAARLEKLENQFPAGKLLDKYASVNDAILSTRHDELARRMDRLESEAMTPGKVLFLLSSVLTVLFAIIAALPWILEQIAN